jgi:hypothetical protein
MLDYLKLENVGPAPEMEMKLAPRLNLITGDNGLGKSFLLDVAWWALTRHWPQDLNPRLTSGYPARPTVKTKKAAISFKLRSKSSRIVSYESTYSRRDESWVGKLGRPWNPALIIYAHFDGGFSVWDPARNYWEEKGGVDVKKRLRGYVFSANQVWHGLKVDVGGKSTLVCNGLLRDWASWIRESGDNAERMAAVLVKLAPEGERFTPGLLTRLSINDARDIPSICTPYTGAVPVLHASSGVRRAIALAYMLMWSWNEHCIAADQLGEEKTSQVVMLFDELESHLHPRWQRSILRSVLESTKILHKDARVQLVSATHSPLILASAEPFFDPNRDAWFDLDLIVDKKRVVLQERDFVRRGTAGRWLTSPAFDLASEGRSLEAEQAIADAEKLLEKRRIGPAPPLDEIEAVDESLRAVLCDVDRFWVRWSAFVDEFKGAQ